MKMINKPKPKHTGCGYERSLRDNKQVTKLVNHIYKFLKEKHLKDFDGIAVSGYSMSLLGPILAYKLKKDVCVIAKPHEQRNSGLDVEGKHSLRWIMVDDLLVTGNTLKRVYNGVKAIDGSLVGVILWHSCGDRNTASFTSKGSYYNDENVYIEGIQTHVPMWLSFHEDELNDKE